jgi:hypothetical protein
MACLVHYYNSLLQTIKSVLSAIGLQDTVYGIPNYSCLLAIELLNDGDVWAVRFMFQNGPAAAYKVTLTLLLRVRSQNSAEWVIQ